MNVLRESTNEKFHDAEIYCIKKNKDSLELYLSLMNNIGNVITFVNPIFWKLTSFEQQNVIFEFSTFDGKMIPEFLLEEYPELNSFMMSSYQISYFDSSIGLGGIIVYEILEIKNTCKENA
ncbi:hypothetical protein [Lysinibacillus sp. G4S2]|uniref:hypothetical protein n=1 Tax=Lysinibacillus sp. G4S2 TaxID=3055859 RepID=UPI0025A0FD9A|nr:hypothetical protein [Lysinibacillus sp. G4S2]MDM5248902.1 hypothetical protein [Lysinibacillus sp. G4S2]